MLKDWRLGAIEARFADLIWNHAPISSGELAKLAVTEFGWKKTTTYTVLKRLCDRGIFQNQNSCVTQLISRQDFYAHQSEAYVQESFNGSLPAFLAAFGNSRKLSDNEINELQKVIDEMRR